MPTFGRKASRMKGKHNNTTSQDASKSKPGLAVDTSFSRHQGQQPEQVYPQNGGLSRFINLRDVRDLEDDGPAGRIKIGGVSPREQLDSRVYASKYSLPSHPAVHKRIKGLRPSPLDLTTDVSPSDRAIPIGIEVPSNALPRQSDTIALPLELQRSASLGKELPTPTIVITPAKEDFDCGFARSPEESRIGSGRRPTSSVYSRYTNTFGDDAGWTPPVPPLPLFAAQSNASLHETAANNTASRFSDWKSQATLSLRTVFEDEPVTNLHARSADTKRLTTASVASRHSRGWWSVITSPFSPSGKSYLRSPLSSSDANDEDRTPMMAEAFGMPPSRLSGLGSLTGAPDDEEPRSAPELGRDSSTNTMRSIPQRSVTAPGTLDMGNADALNIYRRPSKGAAAAYYNRASSLSDQTKPPGATRSMGLDDWSPSQSCYSQSRGSLQSASDGGMRDSLFYIVPASGEGAKYYNPNVRFPSLVPYGEGFGDKDMNQWDPRDSVARASTRESLRSVGSLVDSPSGTDSQRSSFDGSDTSESSFGAPAPADESDNRATQIQPPYPDDRSPFDDSHAVKYAEIGQAEPHGYPAEATPNSADVTAFKDFSATHPAALAFPSPSVHAVNPGHDGVQARGSEDMFSPLLETPQVEQAQTATFMAPESHREVDVVSNRQPTPTPPPNGLGIGGATIASGETSGLDYDQPVEPMAEKPAPYWFKPQRVQSQYRTFGGPEQGDERGLYAPSQRLSEKASISTMSTFGDKAADGDGDVSPPKRSWLRRFGLCLAGLLVLLIALLVVLLVVFLPYPHDSMPVQAEWLNLTGFPPLPTGVATVIQPKTVRQIDGCVDQEALWSCAMPPDEGSTQTEPNFRFQIRFRDGILPKNETAIVPSNNTLARRNLWSNPVYIPAPSAPSTDDQKFIGRTTDNTSTPYDGEQTPFYISLLNASSLTTSSSSSSKLEKRDWHYPYPTPKHTNSSSTSSTSNFHYPGQGVTGSSPSSEAAMSIPQAAEHGNHLPAAAELYPLAYAQPLRLYNRGQSSEHYGFYTYFDRSLYVSSVTNANTSASNSSLATTSGGNVPLDSASAVCTWSQTRLLVQIWTRAADVTEMNATSTTNIPALDSTANDMTAPGSFPYRTTITLDRHGGDANKKGVYCHSLDDEHHVLQDVRTWVAENRAFAGDLVHPAPVPTNDGTTLDKRNGNDNDGIDGGTGGCRCQWENWL